MVKNSNCKWIDSLKNAGYQNLQLTSDHFEILAAIASQFSTLRLWLYSASWLFKMFFKPCSFSKYVLIILAPYVFSRFSLQIASVS